MTPVDLLAVAAHPDDAEVGCGGALVRAADAGLRVAVADLTRGELSTSGDVERRARERDAASDLLGLSRRLSLGLPDGRLGSEPSHRDAVVELLRQTRPRVVLAPPVEDRHPDHAAAGRLVREACFYAGVAKLGSGAPHRPDRLYHYALHHPLEPTFVLDVTAVWERRMAAVLAYESQFGAGDGDPDTPLRGGSFVDFLVARAAFYGSLVGVARGEPFASRGPLRLDALPGLEPPAPPPAGGYRAIL